MGPPLQCFNPELYASLRDCDRRPTQCIAPTARLTRCSYTITGDALREASKLRCRAEQLPDGQERHDVLCKFVLLHCCDKWHTWKLEADRSGCLDQVVYNYGAGIAVAAPQSPMSLSPSMTNSERVFVKEENVGYSSEDTVNVSHAMKLRPRLGSDGLPRRNVTRKIPIFVPYISDPRDSVRDDLLAPVPSKWTRCGQIYTFTWPSHPGYVKIGYTGNSSYDRIEAWRACHPGATLQKTFMSVDFPERMERLIHLQMHKHRYRISVCDKCQKSHLEWFKLDLDEVHQVMNDWVSLSKKAPLYDLSGNLTNQWSQRIKQHVGEISAKTLLSLLDIEIVPTRPAEEVVKKEPRLESLTTREINSIAVVASTTRPYGARRPVNKAIKDEDENVPATRKVLEPILDAISASELNSVVHPLGQDVPFTTPGDRAGAETGLENDHHATKELSLTKAINRFSRHLISAEAVEKEQPSTTFERPSSALMEDASSKETASMPPKEKPSGTDSVVTKASTSSFNSPCPSLSLDRDFSGVARSSDQSDVVSSTITLFSSFAQAQSSLAASKDESCAHPDVPGSDTTAEAPGKQSTTRSILTPLDPALTIAAQAAVQTLTAKPEISISLLQASNIESKEQLQIKVNPPSSIKSRDSTISTVVSDLAADTADTADAGQDTNAQSPTKVENAASFDADDETLVEGDNEFEGSDSMSDSGALIENEDTIVVSEAIAKEPIVPMLSAAKELITTFSTAQTLKEDEMYSFLDDFMKLQANTLNARSDMNKKEELVLPDVPLHEPLILPEIPIALLST